MGAKVSDVLYILPRLKYAIHKSNCGRVLCSAASETVDLISFPGFFETVILSMISEKRLITEF